MLDLTLLHVFRVIFLSSAAEASKILCLTLTEYSCSQSSTIQSLCRWPLFALESKIYLTVLWLSIVFKLQAVRELTIQPYECIQEHKHINLVPFRWFRIVPKDVLPPLPNEEFNIQTFWIDSGQEQATAHHYQVLKRTPLEAL